MGFHGILVGSLLGGCRGSLLGSLLGAWIGHQIEERWIRPAFARRRGRTRASAKVNTAEYADYSLIGARGGESLSELKNLYRKAVMRNHPDALRSRGASEKEIVLATERMKKINAAWGRIKSGFRDRA